MAYRIPYADKGKAIASSSTHPRISRVRVSDVDNTAFLRRHELTLIGRLTNPVVQRTWSIIAFFTDHWKSSTKPIGADLGQGLFQFQFANEEDL